jgi:hypothetical protein
VTNRFCPGPSPWIGVLAVALVWSAVCGRKIAPEDVDQAAFLFQAKIEARQYSAIYDGADSSLRQLTGRDEFIALMRELETSLGRLVERRRVSGLELQRLGDTEVRVVYVSSFENAVVEEHFTWFLRSGELALAGYSVRPVTRHD